MFYQCVPYHCFSLFLSGKFSEKKKPLKKSSKKLTRLRQQTKKKVEHIQPPPKKNNAVSHATDYLCVVLRLCLEQWESFFSRNENVRTRKKNFRKGECKNEKNSFFWERRMQEREQQFCFGERQEKSRKVAIVALMIRYVNLIAKGDENR